MKVWYLSDSIVTMEVNIEELLCQPWIYMLCNVNNDNNNFVVSFTGIIIFIVSVMFLNICL